MAGLADISSGLNAPATAKRELILDAAHKLFRSHGYDKTSTREIAAEAGVGEGTIFYHFSSKAGLLEALSQRFAVQFLDSLMAGETIAALTFPALVDRAFAYVHRFGLRHQQLGLPLDSPELCHFMMSEHEIYQGFMRDILTAHHERAELHQNVEVTAAAELLLAVISHGILAVFAFGRKSEETAFRHEIIRIISAFVKMEG